MKLTVAIPTLNSETVICRALEALFAGQQHPDEVLVIDGGSRDQTIVRAQTFPVRVLSNPKVHAAGGRNVAIQHAIGDVIAFTDSDCVPAADWTERIVKHFERNPELVGIGGKMLALPPTNEIEEFTGHVFLNEIMRFPTKSSFIDGRVFRGAFITANCAYRRNTLLAVGGFRDVFANHAEDIDLFWRIFDQGLGQLYYDPEIVVFHSFQTTQRQLMKKYFQYGISSSKLARYHLGTPTIDWRLYRKLAENLGRFIIPFKRSKWSHLYCLQLASHLLGKYYGSVLVRRINL